MRLFDLHCDTVTECRSSGMSLRENTLHLDRERARCFDAWAQVFAIWIPDDVRGEDAWAYFTDHYDFFLSQLSDTSIRFCQSAADLDAAHQAGAPSALLAVEGGAVLGGRLDKLDALYRMGVRLLTLTWNDENELGYGCQSSGGGLKPFGRDVVRRMQSLRMIVDVSHLNAQGFWDVLEMTDIPVIASHSTSASVLRKTRAPGDDRMFSVRRALDDDQIRAIALRGGLIGLNFCESFLGDPGQDGFDAVLRHARHIRQIGGVDVLAIGSDFDGCTMHPSLAGIDKMPDLYAFLRQNGFYADECEKIFFGNAWHFMKSML